MRRLLLLAGLLTSTACLADNTFIVDTVGDGNPGTLRAAINQMQAANGVQTIRFVFSGSAQIVPNTPLPPLVGQTIVLDGTAAPGLVINAQGWPLFKFHSGNSGQTIRLISLDLRNGSNAEGGGCVDVLTQGYLQVIDSSFDGCVNFGPPASGAGGGAIRTNGPLRLTRSRFSNNQSNDGGNVNLVNAGAAVRVGGPNANSILIERTQFVSNRTVATPASATACSGGQGGALSLDLPAGGSVYLADVQFIDNATTCLTTGSRQTGSGGAMAVYGQGPTSIVTIDRAWFSRNEAREGGAIMVESARLNVNNATFFENTGLAGGNINLLTRTNRPATTIFLRNSTFARGTSTFTNFASYLNVQNGATVSEITNTVFAQPLAGPACTPNAIDVQAGGAVFTGSPSCFFYAPGNVPLSTEFTSNTFGLDSVVQTHGFVPTLALPAGSVLIDNGTNTNCPSTDARGLPRPVNGGQATLCDVGAVEFNPDRLFASGFER
ncbi:MAG: hypothetical protein J0L88_03575 [Xanthomonadales bacterium]|nr:hypothetical protein [Xanthomonadales bacterium]